MRSDLALAALASAAVPGMKPVAVAGLALPIEEAPDHQRAVVQDATGRRWLIRSPLSPVAGARLLRNDELIRQLSRHLPFKVPSPVGRAEVGQDGYAVVYPHVEGFPLDFTRLPAGQGLASAIGRAVAAVHNIPPGVFEAQDVPTFDAPGTRQRLTATVDRAAETGRVPTGLLARWEEAFDAAPLWQFATTPVHGAFRGGAVLVVFADEDASSGRVVAVTDWEEAMVADPALDLADLYARTSPATWESVLDSYVLARAQRPDPYLHARARLLSETNRLGGLAQAVADEDEERIRHIVESLRRMDRLTEDEDSLVPVTARGVGATVPFGMDVQADHDDGGQSIQSDLAAGDPEGPTGMQIPAHVQGPGPDQENLHRGASLDPAGLDDEDATAEVPVVERDLGRMDPVENDEPTTGSAMDDEAMDDEVVADEATDHEVVADEATNDEALTGEDGGAGSDPAEGQERTSAGAGPMNGQDVTVDAPSTEVTEDSGGDDLSDEERLHELYGMPSQPGDDD